MTIATIMLLDEKHLSDLYFCRSVIAKAKELLTLDKYSSMQVFTTMSGEQAAEDIFDLTNNPSRQSEREVKYGNGRSVSVGDIVKVREESFVCVPVGWEKI